MKESLGDRYIKYLNLFNKYPYNTYDIPEELTDFGIIVKYIALRKKYKVGHIEMTKKVLTELEELISTLRTL